MAECPLPKPNTRVRFPSPAPKQGGFHQESPPCFGMVYGLRNRAHATRARGEFAKQICASIVCNRGLVQNPSASVKVPKEHAKRCVSAFW